MSTPTQRRILVLAGPNGAGKTTFAREFLVPDAQCPTFINADLIAAELSPQHPDSVAVRAGRAMLERIRECVARGESFAFETTLADRSYGPRIAAWRRAGYHVTIWFLSLPSPEAAIARVAARVAQGGHGIPEAVVRRRYNAGRALFESIYKHLANEWVLYDNAGREPILLDWGEAR